MNFQISHVNRLDLFHVLIISLNPISSQLRHVKVTLLHMKFSLRNLRINCLLLCKSITHLSYKSMWLLLHLFWFSYQHKPVKVKFCSQMEVIAKRLKNNLVHLQRMGTRGNKSYFSLSPFHLVYTHTYTHTCQNCFFIFEY